MLNSKKLLNKIKKNEIKPIPKWHFIAKNLLFWILFGASILLGSTVLAVIIHAFDDSGIGLGKHFIERRFDIVFEFFPIYWAIFFIIFIMSSYFGLRHTKGGYKYSYKLIIISIIIGSGLFGAFVYQTGQAERLERGFAHTMPMYKGMMERQGKMWNRPDKGLLIGRVVKMDGENYTLITPDNKEWSIEYENAKMINDDIKNGDMIRIIGKKINDNTFKAKEIKKKRR